MSRRTTRREFVKQSAALGAAWWVGTQSAFGDSKSANEQLNFACIGVQGKGSSDTNSAGGNGNVIALCDVDELRLNKKAGEYPKAKKYTDYRKMLEQLEKEIDAVTVSTPDHSHAAASVMAMRMGKHCFCQKPLTWSVEEARTMRRVAQETGVATQMGNQGTARNGLREGVEIMRDGALGKVSEVHVWTNRPIWPQGQGRPEPAPFVPSPLRWYLWLGPAPSRAYHAAYHPFKWRGWLDFGTGALGDMACHTSNMVVMGLDLFDPVSIEVVKTSGIVENETYPKHCVIKFEFPQRGDWPACTMYWYDGGNKPPEELLMGEADMKNSGSLVVGSEGTMYSPGDYGDSYKLLPKEKFADYKKPEPTLPRSPGHFKEFARACKGGPAAMSNFDYAARLTETILLGNVALRAGEKVEYDAKSMEITNLPEANKFLGRSYRDGWTLATS